jgi:hypothetical protein
LLAEIRQAFSAPTVKQCEAYARFLHTLAAASVIGEATLIFAEGAATFTSIGRLVGLTMGGVLCFEAACCLEEHDMDVVFLLVLTAIIAGWGIWVSQRSEGRGPPDHNRRSTDAESGSDR